MPFDLLIQAMPHPVIFEGIIQLMLMSFCMGILMMWEVMSLCRGK